MQSVSFRIWTRVAVSISYDDNHYTMGTSNFSIIILPVFFKILKFLLENMKTKFTNFRFSL